MKLKAYLINTVFILLAVGAAQASKAPDQLDTKMSKWIELRNLISLEKSDWIEEKANLDLTKGLLEAEIEQLKEKLEKSNEENDVSNKELNDLEEKKEALLKANQTISDVITQLEKRTIETVGFFPDPLMEKIDPLLTRIPKVPEENKLPLGQRLQNVVGILSQAEKFNNTVTMVGETREVEKGKKVQVWTLYWGLAGAYYVDVQETFAGYGYPTREGWKWKGQNDLAPSISQLIGVLDGTRETNFVILSSELK